jgi:hypothetical protein
MDLFLPVNFGPLPNPKEFSVTFSMVSWHTKTIYVPDEFAEELDEPASSPSQQVSGKMSRRGRAMLDSDSLPGDRDNANQTRSAWRGVCKPRRPAWAAAIACIVCQLMQ